MGICYLLNPLRQQINVVFHKISHGLELPKFIIPHSTLSADPLVHENHQHIDYQDFHEHEFLDLVNSFFETSPEKNRSNDSFLVTIELDKHLIGSWDLKFKNRFYHTENNYSRNRKNTQKGFFSKSLKPPLNGIGQGS
ncbi:MULTISPECIES: hypothetical protein [unclassified Arenibacter]|uniref:hypothetical protein n=1 Tax=unclassified Arenibacter TaxID=2615047 RepID=UPI0011C0DCB4|nr:MULTISPECIES: hypothetical protein [unclassified Arenibacter]